MDTLPATNQLRPLGQLIRSAWADLNRFFPTLAGIAVIGVIADILFTIAGPNGQDQIALTWWSLITLLLGIFVALWMTTTMYYFLIKRPATTNPFTVYRDSVGFVARVFSTGLLQGVIVFVTGLIIFVPVILVMGLNLSKLAGASELTAQAAGALALGTSLTLIPIIYLTVRWQFSSLLVVTENIANWTALKRSAGLVRGHWWAVFGRLFLFGCLVGLIAATVSAALTPLGHSFPKTIAIVQSILSNILVGPIVVCFSVQLFNELRQRSTTEPPVHV